MNIPKLRFKEFTDEWSPKSLSEVVSFSKGNLLSKSNLDKNGSHPCILYGELYTKYHEVIRKVLSKTNYNSNNIIKSKYGDILIPASGETPIDISTSSCLLLDNVLLGGDINVLSPKSCDGRFISYMINNNKKKDIARVAQGHSIVHLYSENLKKINLNIPSLSEQNKISDMLELLDKKIELHAKKLEALKLFKKGLINYLFSQNTTMKIRVKDLGTIITGTTPSKENNFFWSNGNIPWITPSDIAYERDISNGMVNLTEEGLLNGRSIPKNSILVTCIASIGKNAVLKVNGSCNQQINAIIPNKSFNHNYIYYLMEYMSNYMKSIAGTSATSIINKNDFEKLSVNIHSIKEQIKIDKLLSSIEAKEKLENKYLYNITRLKGYLIQNMFI